jgi:hypothetical protein
MSHRSNNLIVELDPTIHLKSSKENSKKIARAYNVLANLASNHTSKSGKVEFSEKEWPAFC